MGQRHLALLSISSDLSTLLAKSQKPPALWKDTMCQSNVVKSVKKSENTLSFNGAVDDNATPMQGVFQDLAKS
jgi:hypothetical protein